MNEEEFKKLEHQLEKARYETVATALEIVVLKRNLADREGRYQRATDKLARLYEAVQEAKLRTELIERN